MPSVQRAVCLRLSRNILKKKKQQNKTTTKRERVCGVGVGGGRLGGVKKGEAFIHVLAEKASLWL